jgi:hypothetical protein
VQTFNLLIAMVLACGAVWCINHMRPAAILFCSMLIFWFVVAEQLVQCAMSD